MTVSCSRFAGVSLPVPDSGLVAQQVGNGEGWHCRGHAERSAAHGALLEMLLMLCSVLHREDAISVTYIGMDGGAHTQTSMPGFPIMAHPSGLVRQQQQSWP